MKRYKIVGGKLVDVDSSCFCGELASVDRPCSVCQPVTRVVNRHSHKPGKDDVYIGRPSKWGNVFSTIGGAMVREIVPSRDEAVRRYLGWIKSQVHLMDALPELQGKTLVCSCKPLLCHGDVLVALVAQARAERFEADPHATAQEKLDATMYSRERWLALPLHVRFSRADERKAWQETAKQEECDRREDLGLTPISAKVAYVKTQGQSRSHGCHWPGCNKQVPPAMWSCRTHWYALPKYLRDKIWRAYEIGQEVTMTPSREYLDLMDEVQHWIAEHG